MSDGLHVDVSKYKTLEGYNFNGILIANMDEIDVSDSSLEGTCFDSFGEVFGFTYEQIEGSDRTEGPYVHDDFGIKKGDIVIDAGAHMGDFAAYACYKGASKVYAFEPAPETYKVLIRTAELNKPSLIPVAQGLSDKNSKATLYMHYGAEACNTMEFKRLILEIIADIKLGYRHPYPYFDVIYAMFNRKRLKFVTLDSFVKDNKIEKVDFIKADIEGAERKMLTGAKNILKTMQPKLSICTYHYPDDPDILPKIILDANPDYTIVQNKKKLFAYVKGK
jgi:FkbM family methyltransferase